MSTRMVIAALMSDEGKSDDIRAPIAGPVLRKLYSSWGRSPVIVEAFNLYADLKDRFDAQAAEEELHPLPDLPMDFVRAMRTIDHRIDLETSRARLESLQEELLPFLRRVARGPVPVAIWKQVNILYADLLQTLAADKSIYTSLRRLPGGASGVRWFRIQSASAKEEATEKLREENPELYDRLQAEKQLNQEVRNKIIDVVKADGLEPVVKPLAGVPVVMGIDPVTEEATVYDRDGSKLTVGDFVAKFKEKGEARKKLREKVLSPRSRATVFERAVFRVNPARKMREDLFQEDAEFGLEEIQEALKTQKEDYKSLTDDPENMLLATKVLPVVKIQGDEVISRGRYRGIRLRNMVSEAGRLIEGSHFYRDPDTDQMVPRSKVVVTPGSKREKLEFSVQNDTYVTEHNGKLYLKVGFWSGYKQVRQELNRLAAKPGSTVVRFGKFREMGFEFEPKDFGQIQKITGELSMSNAARKVLDEYFQELARAERASQARNLARYSSENLGLRLPLRQHVKKALAWLDANGNKGICALDTGMGKTVAAIAAMIKMHKQGLTSGNNGRFLYVCDKALVGNLPSEIHKFLEPSDAADLVSRVDVIPYNRSKDSFVRQRALDPNFGDDYTAIFFDEAHLYMKKKNNAIYKAAVSCKCPRKILTTASPMVKSPREVYTMSSVANSADLNLKENRNEERRFVNMYTETVGGRPVGVRREEDIERAYQTWAKRNLFFESKTNVVEEAGQVGELQRAEVQVVMPEEIVSMYRAEAARVREGMAELLQRYKENPMLAYDEVGSKASGPLRELTRLIDSPNRVIPGAPNPKIDRAVEVAFEAMGSSRVMYWADSPELAEDTFDRMRARFPSKGHVLALSNAIFYADAANQVHKYTSSNFGKLVGKRDEKGKPQRIKDPETGKFSYLDPRTGAPLDPREWQSYIFQYVLGMGNTRTEKVVMTAVLTGGYAVGQNLQSFSKVVHLDRDGWSNETMKQRTARAWRAGNKKVVEEITIDVVYPPELTDADKTLDEYRRQSQELDDKLFTQVVLDAQKVNLGEEWYRIKKLRSESFSADKRLAAVAMSPYLEDYLRELAEASYLKELENQEIRREQERALSGLEEA